MKLFTCLLLFVLSISCVKRPFQAVAAKPFYLLRLTDRVEITFSESLNVFGGMTRAGSILIRQWALEIETAFFREGTTERGVKNFLGTEGLSLHVRPSGVLEELDRRSGAGLRRHGSALHCCFLRTALFRWRSTLR